MKTLELVSNVEGVYEGGIRPSNTTLQAPGRPKTKEEPRSKNARIELILSVVIMINTVEFWSSKTNYSLLRKLYVPSPLL